MKHLISACSGCFPSYPCLSMQLYRESFPKCNSYSFSCEIKAATFEKRRKLYSQRKAASVSTPAALLKLQVFNSGMLIASLQKAGVNEDRWPGQHCLLQFTFRSRASCVWGGRKRELLTSEMQICTRLCPNKARISAMSSGGL